MTRKLERRRFAPGEIILRQGELPDNFYIITRGEIEVVVHPTHAPEIVVAPYGAWAIFR